ncbi:hypothetical protein CHUAL_009236 [Chamberlinius hualienensis]
MIFKVTLVDNNSNLLETEDMDKQVEELELESESQNLRWFTPSLITAELCGITAITMIIVWLGHFHEGFSWTGSSKAQFNYHPVLMMVGMIFLYGNAIMIYRIFRNERKKLTKLVHGVIHATIFILAVIALQAVFQSHNRDSVANVYSIHSWLGIATMVVFTCQLLAGFISFQFPGLRMNLRTRYLPIHVFFGLGCFLLAIATALTGITEKVWLSIKDTYPQMPSEGVLVNCLALILIIFAFMVTFLVINPNYKRKPLPEEQMPLVSQQQN